MRRSLLIITFLNLFIFANDTPSIDSPLLIENLVSDLRHTLIERSSKIFDTSPPPVEIKTNELTVDLKNPNFTNGILTTHEGGVIKNSDLRIQAKTIQYIKRSENGVAVHKIEAEGSLMVIYKDKVFVGEELEYDFIEKTGVIYSGKTYTSPWYLIGDKIILGKDGDYKIENVSITTCESADSSWDIHAGSVSVEKKELMSAKKVRFRIFQFPLLWFPSFKLNLRKFLEKPIIRYKVNWDKSTGPRGSIRYQAYSWEDFAFFLRLDYRYNSGFGGAVETEYFPSHKRTSFVTRSYLAQDIIPNDLTKKRRYRYQGSYHHDSEDKKTKAFLTWDKYSDIRMPNDFKSDDFEIDTAKKTEFMWRNEQTNFITLAHTRARVNSFETIKQDIPSIYANIRPLKFNRTGIISSNWMKVSYLDYSYSNDIRCLNDFHSVRAETHNELYRTLNLSGIKITPKAGFIGIYYNNSPTSNRKGVATFLYGGKIQTDLWKRYKNNKHIIEPYVEYKGLTTPSTDPDKHYIFSIKDGYNRMNMLRLGLLNQIYKINKLNGKPAFETNAYANFFFGDAKTKLITPKGYLSFKWNLPSTFISNENAWNFNKKKIDFSNSRIGWTVNENIALSFEFRYRSHYDWRKADRDNFILDATRDENEMLLTPLSDKRYSFLSHLFIRINPYWTCHFQSHHGWNRDNEPGYNEYKIDLYTLLSTSWKIRLSFMHTEADDRFTFDYFLLKF